MSTATDMGVKASLFVLMCIAAHLVTLNGILDRHRQVLPTPSFQKARLYMRGETFNLIPKVSVVQDFSSKYLRHVFLLPGI